MLPASLYVADMSRAKENRGRYEKSMKKKNEIR